ncbi:conserved hypothetical protein [Pseudomonas sp. 9AZ]|uniref:DUF6957 family protein n=1 Tax=Pseudomonas sp. 9AZ TaxID=2653168 RepID=UPI0012F30E24|nr:conserved hypothetical protein [Pseudomonas sp. 9AZ]
MAELQEITDLLFSTGIPMPGALVDQEEAIRIVRERFPYSEYCLVRDWIWIDLYVTPAQHAELVRTQRQPVLAYAHTVIYDSSRRWDVGDFVRTSYLHAFHDGFMFQTVNRVYILLGDGVRKRATLETVGRVF